MGIHISQKSHLTVHKKLPEYYFTIWVAFFGGEIDIAYSLGNPFDMLQKLESSGKVKEQSPLDFGKALSMFLPLTLNAMFFLNFIYIAILTQSLAFRVHAYSILMLFLLYYVLALVETMSGSRVMWSFA